MSKMQFISEYSKSQTLSRIRSAIMAVMGAGILSILVPSSGMADEALYVKVRNAALKSKPGYFSSSVNQLSYGAQVTQIAVQGDWIEVKSAKGGKGFIHQSAVSDKKVILSASSGSAGVNAEQSDVILAGKGFGPEVEKEFSKQNADLNYAAVNSMEKVSVSSGEVKSFASLGKLSVQ